VRLIALAGAVLALSAGLAAAGGTRTSVTGHVYLAAPEPQCSGSTCATPARFVTLRLRSAGGVDHIVRTDKYGAFKLALAPGPYAVSAVSDSRPAVTPAHAVVRQSATQRLTFLYRLSP
jgi:hypothetical protein